MAGREAFRHPKCSLGENERPRLRRRRGSASPAVNDAMIPRASWRDEAFYTARRRGLSVALLLVALVLRLAYLAEFQTTPYADHPIVDAQAYDDRAQEIAAGDWLGDRIYYQDPFYPYALASFYTVFGHRYLPVYLAQALLGAALCLVVVALARALFEGAPFRERAAWLAGFAAALCTPFLFYEQLILKTSLGLFLGTAHLTALAGVGTRLARREEVRRAVALGVGVLLGLNLLNRGNYVLLAPLFAAWLLWRGGGARRSWRAIGLYVAGAVLVVAPVTLRNRAVGGEWVLITSQGGQNFYLGNNERNETGSYVMLAEVRPTPTFEQVDFQSWAERDLGRDVSSVEASRHFYRKSWAWIASEPAAALRLFAKKLGLWFAGEEHSDNYDFGLLREEFSHVLKLPLVTGYTVGLLGWAGLLVALVAGRRTAFSVLSNPNLALGAGFLIVYSLSIVAFFVFSRYRLPVYPVLIVFGAGLLCWLPGAWRTLPGARRLAVAACAAVAAFAVLWPFLVPGWKHWSFRDRTVEYFNLGSLLVGEGRVDEAVPYFERVLAEPRAIPVALAGSANVFLQLGRLEEAREAYSRAVEQVPDDPGAVLGLATTLATQGRAAEARPHYAHYVSLVAPAADSRGAPGASENAPSPNSAPRVPTQAEPALAEASRALVASRDPAEFGAGLRALGRLVHLEGGRPPWLTPLLGLELDPSREALRREFLGGLARDERLAPEALRQVRAHLDGL